MFCVVFHFFKEEEEEERGFFDPFLGDNDIEFLSIFIESLTDFLFVLVVVYISGFS